MSTRRFLSVVSLLLAACLVLPSAALAQNPHTGSVAVPVTGTFGPSTTATGPLSNFGSGTLTGTLNLQSFSVVNGTLTAVGSFVGTLTNTAGQVTNIVTNVAIPVANATGSCPILSLTLGPLHLDLLGLVVDLNQVNLNITAQSGPGNLLGNLLCDVANLLNGNGALQGVANLLNQILAGL